MIDEDKLTQDAARGTRARHLLENERLQEALKALRAEYSAALMATTPDRADARERFYMAYQAVSDFERHLTSIVHDGTIAARQLRDIAERPRPAWHEIR